MAGICNAYRFGAAGVGGSDPTPPTPPTSTKWRINCTATQSSTAWLSINEMEMRGSVGGADQCNGGTATASAQSGSAPVGNAFNNNTGSRYQSGTSTKPIWVQYEFPSAVSVAEVAIFCGSATDGPKNFTIQYWDGAAWVTVYTGTNIFWENNSWRYFQTEDPLAFYGDVRLVFTAVQGGGTTRWPRVAEIEMRASAGGADQCSGGAGYGSSTSANAPAAGFDNSATEWLAGLRVSQSPWLAYRFAGASPDIHEVALTATSQAGDGINDTPTSVTVQRHDGTAWQDLWSFTTPATWVAGEQRVFTDPAYI
jgi:hypothetical protein